MHRAGATIVTTMPFFASSNASTLLNWIASSGPPHRLPHAACAVFLAQLSKHPGL
jgi:hypothetical protein